MRNQMYTRTLPLLLGIFLVSVLIRLPNLNRPLSKHHEFCTAVSLRVLQIWSEGGIANYGFNPVMNYSNAADKYINNHATTTREMVDEEGNFYYVSHPPFAYYLPYAVFWLAGIAPSVLALQVFNLFLHFLSGFFVYLIVSLLGVNEARKEMYVPAVVAYVIYIFSPPTLWFQSNVYMSDMLVHTIFVIGIYTTLKLIIRQRFSTFKYLFNFFLVIFLMVYTSWLGVFFTISFLLYGLFRAEKNSGFAIPVTIAFFGMIMALGLTIYQYSTINGIESYLNEATSRFHLRGSFRGDGTGLSGAFWTKIHEVRALGFNYAANYLPIFMLLAAFSFFMFQREKPGIVFSENGFRFLYLAAWPIVWLHVFLMNYSGQDFTTLYASVFFATTVGIMYDKLMQAGLISRFRMNAMLGVTVLAMVAIYFFINRPGEVSWKGDDYAKNMRAGLTIRENAKPETVMFLSNEPAYPQLVVYAGRNVQSVNNPEQALVFLEQRGLANGMLFKRELDGTLILDRELSLPSTNE